MQRGNFHSQKSRSMPKVSVYQVRVALFGKWKNCMKRSIPKFMFYTQMKEKEQMTIKQLKMQYWDQVYNSRSLKKIR